MQIAIKIQVPASVKKKGKHFISCCPVLDVCSQGETKKKALDNLVEALSLFLISCYERGTLDEVLKESGFVPSRTAKKDKPFPSKYESLSVPLPFHIKKDPHQCHA